MSATRLVRLAGSDQAGPAEGPPLAEWDSADPAGRAPERLRAAAGAEPGRLFAVESDAGGAATAGRPLWRRWLWAGGAILADAQARAAAEEAAARLLPLPAGKARRKAPGARRGGPAGPGGLFIPKAEESDDDYYHGAAGL